MARYRARRAARRRCGAIAALVAVVFGAFGLSDAAAADIPAPGPSPIQVQAAYDYIYDGGADVPHFAIGDQSPSSGHRTSGANDLVPSSDSTGNVYDGSAFVVAPRALPAFSRSSIDDAVTSVSRAHNDQISVGARAIDKRLGANSAPFQGIEATTANAQALVTDILENPTRTVFGRQTYDVYNAAGQGARFNVSSNRFITFLDETIATR